MSKLKYYLVLFFKREKFVGQLELILFVASITIGMIWLLYDRPKLEPIALILASIGGILDVIKRIINESKFPRLSFSEAQIKSTRESSFYWCNNYKY